MAFPACLTLCWCPRSLTCPTRPVRDWSPTPPTLRLPMSRSECLSTLTSHRFPTAGCCLSSGSAIGARSNAVSDDSALHEKPLEFLTSIANTGGSCDGQAILPVNGHFRCTCSCGDWDVEVDDPQEGLRQARIHTGSVTG